MKFMGSDIPYKLEKIDKSHDIEVIHANDVVSSRHYPVHPMMNK